MEEAPDVDDVLEAAGEDIEVVTSPYEEVLVVVKPAIGGISSVATGETDAATLEGNGAEL